MTPLTHIEMDSPESTAGEPWTQEASLVFLIGAPRSGTTWLQSLIASHPSVASGPETHFFAMAAEMEAFFQGQAPMTAGLKTYITEANFNLLIGKMFHEIGSALPQPARRPWVLLEKSPQHCFFANSILKALPRARFIHLIRDGRDVVRSVLHAGATWAKGHFPTSVTIASQLWKNAVIAGRKISVDAKADQYLEVRYEALRRDPADVLFAIFNWIGLTCESTSIHEYLAANDITKVSADGQFAGIDSPVLSREGKSLVQPHGFAGDRAPSLSSLQKHQLHAIAGDLLVDLGYVDARPKTPLWAKVASSWRVRSALGLRQV